MKTVSWKIHLSAATEVVFNLLTTAEGRERFWAEEAREKDGVIRFSFPNGELYNGRIMSSVPNKEFQLIYFDSLVKFDLEPTENGGTDLTLVNEGIPEEDFVEVSSGWVSVLMNLKAAADFQCDLRNHDRTRTWNQGFADN